MKSILTVAETYFKMATGKLQEGQDNKEIDLTPDKDNLAAQDAESAQKKQEPKPEIPSWVPGNLPEDEKHEFAEAAKAAYESDNNTFDFKGRTYKITEKELVGNQDKLDVNGNGKIDSDDLAALRAGKKPVGEHNLENEVETPGQTQYPGSTVKDVNGNGRIDGEDKPEMAKEDEDKELDESVRTKKAQDMMLVNHGAMSMADYKKKWANIKSKPKNPADHAVKEDAIKEGEEERYNRSTGTFRTGHTQYKAPLTVSHAEKARQASDEAHRASQHAEKTKSPEHFHAAAKAHEHAIEMHKAADKAAYTPGLSGGKQQMHAGYAAHARERAAYHSKNPVKEGAENPTDTLTIDVPAMIRALEKAREDFKTDEDIHNFVQGLLKKKDSTIDTNALPTNEALDPKADAGVWIKDFQDSDDPKFAGKSKDERKQQALAAWYAARRDAGIKESADAGPADAKAGPEVMDPLTQATKDDHDDETKVEEAPYTNKADGSENIVPATKNAPNPTPTPTLKKENTMTDPIKSIRSVAESYAEMTNTQLDEGAGYRHDDTVAHHLAATIHHLKKAKNTGGSGADNHLQRAKAHADAASEFATLDNTQKSHINAQTANELVRDYHTDNASKFLNANSKSHKDTIKKHHDAATFHARMLGIHNDREDRGIK